MYANAEKDFLIFPRIILFYYCCRLMSFVQARAEVKSSAAEAEAVELNLCLISIDDFSLQQ